MISGCVTLEELLKKFDPQGHANFSNRLGQLRTLLRSNQSLRDSDRIEFADDTQWVVNQSQRLGMRVTAVAAKRLKDILDQVDATNESLLNASVYMTQALTDEMDAMLFSSWNRKRFISPPHLINLAKWWHGRSRAPQMTLRRLRNVSPLTVALLVYFISCGY